MYLQSSLCSKLYTPYFQFSISSTLKNFCTTARLKLPSWRLPASSCSPKRMDVLVPYFSFYFSSSVHCSSTLISVSCHGHGCLPKLHSKCRHSKEAEIGTLFSFCALSPLVILSHLGYECLSATDVPISIPNLGLSPNCLLHRNILRKSRISYFSHRTCPVQIWYSFNKHILWLPYFCLWYFFFSNIINSKP